MAGSKLDRLAERAVQLGFLGALAFAWYFASDYGHVSTLILPPLGTVLSAFAALLRSGAFWPDLRVTLFELVLAVAIAAILGSFAGYLISRSRAAIVVFDPLLSGLYAVPTILLFPLYVLFFGLGPTSKIAMGASIAFFPIALNMIAGLDQVESVYIQAARSMGASPWQMARCVLLPAAFPIILAGLRMGAILAFLAILGAETIASLSGLGHRIVTLAEDLDMAKMYAYVFLAIGVAVLLNLLLSVIEARGRGPMT